MANAKMIARDAGWCRHYGKRGRKGDQERRMIKRSDRNKAKQSISKELAK